MSAPRSWFFFWGGIARPNVDVPPAGRFQPTAPVESFVVGSLVRREEVELVVML